MTSFYASTGYWIYQIKCFKKEQLIITAINYYQNYNGDVGTQTKHGMAWSRVLLRMRSNYTVRPKIENKSNGR